MTLQGTHLFRNMPPSAECRPTNLGGRKTPAPLRLETGLSRGLILLCLSLLLVCPNLFAQAGGEIQLERDVLTRDDIIELVPDGGIEIISASRSAKRVDELPLSVYVVRREDILRNGWTTLVDVLKHVPGIRVSQPGGGAEGEIFMMRGLVGNNYTKFLINNIPIQPSTGSGMPIGAQLPVRQAERIEIIIGPSSAIYGADAFAGVINIVTREAVDDIFVTADVNRGGTGYEYVNFMVGGKAGLDDEVFNYSFYGSLANEADIRVKHVKSDVYNPLNYFEIVNIDGAQTGGILDTVFQPYYKGTRTEPEFGRIPHHSSQMGVRLSYKGISMGFERMTRRDHSSLGQSSFLFNYNSPSNHYGETIQRSTLSANYDLGPFPMTTSISHLRMRADPLTSLGTAYSNNGVSYTYQASDDIFAEQLVTFQALADTEVIGGMSIQHSANLPRINERSDPFDEDFYSPYVEDPPILLDSVLGDFGFYPLTFTNVAAFLQVYQRWNNFVFIGGLRLDDNSLYGSSFNPRLAALWRLSKRASIRASWGRAFRAPSTWYSRNSIAFVVPGHGVRPDSAVYAVTPAFDLEPEQTHSMEIGLRKEFDPDTQLDLVLYFNSVDKRIAGIIDTIDRTLYPLSIDSVTRIYANGLGDPSRLFSAQASLQLRNLVPSIGMDLMATTTWSIGRENLPEDGGEIPEFRMVPKFLGQLSLSLNPWADWHLRADAVMATSWTRRFTPSIQAYENEDFSEVDGYFTLDLVSRYHIDDRIYVIMDIKNVFNTEYAGIGSIGWDVDLPYNPQRLRRATIGISFELN